MELFYNIGSIVGLITFISVLIFILVNKFQWKFKSKKEIIVPLGKLIYIAFIFFGTVLIAFGIEHTFKNFKIIDNIKDYTLFLGVFTIIFSVSVKYLDDLKDFFRNENDSIRNYKNEINNKLQRFEIVDTNIFYTKILNLDLSELDYFDRIFLDKQNLLSDRLGTNTEKDNFVKGMYSLCLLREKKLYNNSYNTILNQTVKLLSDAIKIAKSEEKNGIYLAEYNNYIGVTYDYTGNYIKAIDFYIESIKNQAYEKPFFNIACSLASIFNMVKLDQKDYKFFKDKIDLDLIWEVIIAHPKKGQIPTEILDAKDIKDKQSFLQTFLHTALASLSISILLKSDNIKTAQNVSEKNELLTFKNCSLINKSNHELFDNVISKLKDCN